MMQKHLGQVTYIDVLTADKVNAWRTTTSSLLRVNNPEQVSLLLERTLSDEARETIENMLPNLDLQGKFFLSPCTNREGRQALKLEWQTMSVHRLNVLFGVIHQELSSDGKGTNTSLTMEERSKLHVQKLMQAVMDVNLSEIMTISSG